MALLDSLRTRGINRADRKRRSNKGRPSRNGPLIDLQPLEPRMLMSATPTHLAVTAAASTSIALGWTASAGASGYTVSREAPGETDFTEVGTTTAAAFTDTDLSPGTTYLYEVTADDSSGSSSPAGPFSAATVPGVSLADEGGVAESETYTLDVTADYTGSDPITSLSINWGDGGTSSPSAHSGQFTHVYNDSGIFVVSVTANSAAGAGHSALRAYISDPTPYLEMTQSDDTIAQGATLTVTPTLTRTAADELNGWVVDWGDGTTDNYGSGATPSFTHAYAHGLPGSSAGYIITVAAATSDGVFAASGGISVTAPASPPPPATTDHMWVTSDVAAVEDQQWSLTVQTCNVATPPSSYAIDFGDGTTGSATETTDLGGGNILYTATHTYAEEGLYYVTASGGDLSVSQFFDVGETTPSIASIADKTVASGAAVSLSTTVSGIPLHEPVKAFVDWGDGRGNRAVTFTNNGNGTGTITASLTHAYGYASVIVTLYDQDGDAVSTSFILDAGELPPLV